MRIVSLKTLIFLGKNGCDFGGHKILGIPRSTMWAHINELEKELGVKLVNRKKQSTTLTEEAKSFIPYAIKLVDVYLEGVHSAHNQNAQEIKGEIVIATTAAVSSSWLMPSLKDFYQKHQNLRINIIANDILPKQTERTSDILLRPVGEDLEGFQKIWYIPYHHVLFASPEYIKQHGEPKTPEDLLKHKMLAYGEHEFTYFDDINWHIKGKHGIPRLTPSITVNSTTSLFNAAKEGLGIISAPRESNEIYKGGLVHILPKIKGPIVRTYFCMKKTNNVSAQNHMDLFREFMEEYFKTIGIKIFQDKHEV